MYVTWENKQVRLGKTFNLIFDFYNNHFSMKVLYIVFDGEQNKFLIRLGRRWLYS